MTRAEWIRAGALYFPIALALVAGMLRGGERRLFAGCPLSVLWTAPALLGLQRLNEWAGWWTFAHEGVTFGGMPLELYLGWIVLWGMLPELGLERLGLGWCTAPMVVVDLIAMPLCRPVVELHRGWLGGEAVAALLVLLPGLCVARWTLEESHLRARAALQVAIAAMLFFYLLPEMGFAMRPGRGWAPLLAMPGWQVQIAVQLILVAAVPGLGAVAEFAGRGRGTPIPYDPPRRLVTSGIYRYCANPMQMSCALVMVLWAGLLRNGWLVAVAAVAIVYGAGIAEWDERQDLARRFGEPWRQYRAQVRNWQPRWRPYHAGPVARLYIAASCGPCCELRGWLVARQPLGMDLMDAETLPGGAIRRLRYDPCEGDAPVEGVRALGRALEHLHLGWAVAGAALRLPGVWQLVQLVMNASGLGPRELGVQAGTEPLV